MTKKKLETEVEETVEGAKESKQAEKKKSTKNNELTAKILAVMETLRGNGVQEVNSTTLRHKIGTKNRAVIRRAMKGLVKQGKVVINEKAHGRHKQYTYKLA